MKTIYPGLPFVEEIMKYFLKELKNHNEMIYDNEEFNSIKTKVAKKEYIKDTLYPSMFDTVMDIIIEKYEIDLNNDYDAQIAETLVELLESHEVKTKITNKIIKKYVI